MEPNDWRELEAGREERHMRVHNPHGTAPSSRTRLIAAVIIIGGLPRCIQGHGLLGACPGRAGPHLSGGEEPALARTQRKTPPPEGGGVRLIG